MIILDDNPMSYRFKAGLLLVMKYFYSLLFFLQHLARYLKQHMEPDFQPEAIIMLLRLLGHLLGNPLSHLEEDPWATVTLQAVIIRAGCHG